jgi:integrase
MARATLTQKFIDKAECPDGQKKVDFFDTGLKGFLIEVRATGGRTYYIRYRSKRGVIRVLKIGDASLVRLDDARQAARKLLAQISLGDDPSEQKAILRSVPTLAEFVSERYLPFINGYKSPLSCDESLLRNHILPRLGKKHLDQITRHDVIAMHHGRRAEGAAPGSANRLLVLTRYIFNLALRWEIPGVTANPAKGVALFEENNLRERYLSTGEVQALYKALLDSDNTQLRYIVPMLILTGARKREVLDSEWSHFDLARRSWRIPISKTGKARHVPLSAGMLTLLAEIPRFDGCRFVVPNPVTLRPYVSIFVAWDTARKKAGLADVRLHDLRHSFASFLINSGRSIYEVQKILGHTQIKTTQRYSHLSQETLLDAADAAMDAAGIAFAPATTTMPHKPVLAIPAEP